MMISRALVRNRCVLVAMRHNQITVRSMHANIFKRPNSRFLRSFAEKRCLGVLSMRLDSTQSNVQSYPAAAASETLPDIPKIPPEILPDVPVVEVTPILNKLGEVPLAEYGLCNYTPVGLIQKLLELAHVELGLPWWGSIAVCVLVARMLLFPVVIFSQRHSIKFNNLMPQFQELQMRVSDARTYGNQMEALKASQEMALFMRDNQLNPMKNMIYPLAQSPVFLSFFLGLRKMANVPVESMMCGGMLWFVDLTIPDQLYLLPGMTAFTMWVAMEIAVDLGRLPVAYAIYIRYIRIGIKVLPFLIFPFIMNFPAAVLVYWFTTNCFTVIQVSTLRIPIVRQYFKIERKKSFSNDDMPRKSKGFFTDIKSSYKNMKIAKEVADRERLDEMAFKRAGRVPPVKTLKYDPALVESMHIETKTAKKQ